MGELVNSPSISFILPAFNEGAVIERSLGRLDRVANGNGFLYEIIVVDDGSMDDTRFRALQYANRNSHVRVVGYDRNLGKGFAVREGFWRSKGDIVIFVDADLEIDYGIVRRYVEALKNADIIIGSKWHRESVVDVSFVRKLLSRGYNVIVRLLTGLRVCDTQCGIKAVRRRAFGSVFRRLSVKRYAFDVELLVLARVFGLRVVELPVKLKLSSMFSFREIWRMFLDLLGITYRLRVKNWYQRGIS
jgi:glycosyltransferase involved in cell wall biosynthesis